MSSTASLGVLLPTRDSAALLPAHLESMRPWLDLASEIVVVDSDSSDGTVDILRAILPPGVTRYYRHPPGLYQSWNFGIRQIASQHAYISTVGDSITRAGLLRLLDVAERWRSDVTLSRPRVIDANGAPRPQERWPIDDALQRLRITEPCLLSRGEQFVIAATNLWGALLGSSASNLYRASCLRARPFPVGFGTAGDGGWALKNIFDIKIAVTPEEFSTFRHHEKSYSLASYRVESVALKFFRLLQETARSRRADDATVAIDLARYRWNELEPLLETAAVAQETLEKTRAAVFPWHLRPSAWAARSRRNHAERRIREIKKKLWAGGRRGD